MLIPSLTLIAEVLVSVGICGLLLFVEPVGAIIVAVTLGTLTLAYGKVTNAAIGRWGEARRFHEVRRVQHIQQGLGGIKIVRLLGREAEFVKRYEVHNAESARVARNQSSLLQLPRLGLEVLVVVALSSLVVSLAARGRTPEQIIAVVGMFAAATFRLMPSANRVIASIQSLKYGEAIVTGLFEEAFASGGYPPLAQTSVPVPFERELDAHGITFAYPGAGVAALRDVSFRVERGEYVGIIGESGSGKSTLVDVLLGLHLPDSGVLRVDGVDLSDPEKLRGWQAQVGYVPQDIYLTDDTLRRNIALGIPDVDIDEAALRRALEGAQLLNMVDGLEEGLETEVGERGVRLSGGQRQRIGIARALYSDPEVLIFDEATSALDVATEAEIMAAIRPLKGEKTIVMVTHRLASLKDCDRVVTMDGGRVMEGERPLETRGGGSGDGLRSPEGST